MNEDLQLKILALFLKLEFYTHTYRNKIMKSYSLNDQPICNKNSSGIRIS